MNEQFLLDAIEKMMEEKLDAKIGALRSEMNERFEAMNQRFDEVDQRLANMDARITRLAVDVRGTKLYSEQAALYAGDLFERLASDVDDRFKKLETN